MTGWKSVYVNRGFTRRINEVTKDESDVILQYLFNVSIHSSHYSIFEIIVPDTINDSFSPKTMTLRFGSNGTRTMWLFGTTALHGILPLMIIARRVLGTACVVWERVLIMILSRNLGGRLWRRKTR